MTAYDPFDPAVIDDPYPYYARLREACRAGSTKVFYLATAPRLFSAIAGHLHGAGLADAAARRNWPLA